MTRILPNIKVLKLINQIESMKSYVGDSIGVGAVHNIKTLPQKITEEMLMARDMNGDTLLHSAVKQNCLKELISKFNFGVKITEKMLMVHDAKGDTILHIADEQFPELVKGFSRDITLTPTLMAKAVNRSEISALDYPISDIKKLIAAGLKITSVAELSVNGCNVLYEAIKQKCLKELVGAFGYGVLEQIFHVAMKHEIISFDNLYKSLTNAGIKITEKMLTVPNASGFTALDYAVFNGNLKCLTDVVAGSSSNADALSVFIKRNKVDYCDTKENLIFFNPPSAKGLNVFGGQEYNLFNLELLKQYFNVFEISNLSDARDIRKIDLQKTAVLTFY